MGVFGGVFVELGGEFVFFFFAHGFKADTSVRLGHQTVNAVAQLA